MTNETYLQGIAKEKCLIGKEIVENVFDKKSLKDTIEYLETCIKVFDIIEKKYDIKSAQEIIRYAENIAVHLKG